MNQTNFQKLLFTSAVLSVAVDGEIHESELNEIQLLTAQTAHFLDFDYKIPLEEIVTQLKDDGKTVVNKYLKSLKESDLSEQQKITIIDVVLKMISADKTIHDNEQEFLHHIISNINISEELLLIKFPGYIEYLGGANKYDSTKTFNTEIKFL